MAAAEQLAGVSLPPKEHGADRPASITECLEQQLWCPECGRWYSRATFWAREEPLVCACGERIGYRCPWVECEHHIALNRSWGKQGAQPPERAEVALVKSFCRLELVHRRGGPLTLEEVGQQDGTVRERIRQLEAKGLKRLRAILKGRGYTAEDVQTYLAQVASSRAAADVVGYVPAGASSRGATIEGVRASIKPSPVSHPPEAARTARKGPVALPLPPSLAPHRASLGRRSRPRRAEANTTSKLTTVTERPPLPRPTPPVPSSEGRKDNDERPQQRPSRNSGGQYQRPERSPRPSLPKAAEGHRGEAPPSNGAQEGELRPQGRGVLHRRRARRGEGLRVPDRQHRPQEPAPGPGEGLGAPREDAGLTTATKKPKPKRRRYKPRVSKKQRKAVLDWIHVCQAGVKATELVQLTELASDRVRAVLKKLSEEGLIQRRGFYWEICR